MIRRTSTRASVLITAIASLLAAMVVTQPRSSNAQMVQGAYAGNDPTLPVIDVYYNVGFISVGKTEDMTADEVSVDFIEVPANVSITASIAEGSSTSVGDAFYSDTFSFPVDTNYIQVVNGLRVPGDFAANPDGRSTAIAVHQLDDVKRSAAHADSVDLIVYHGSTDAPGVDVTVRGGATLATALSYGDRSGQYVALKGGELFTVDVSLANGGAVVESYVGVLPVGISGQAALMMIRGFANPAANGGGRGLTVTVVPASGAAFDLAVESTTGFAEWRGGEAPSGFKIESVYPNPVRRADGVPLTVRVVARLGEFASSSQSADIAIVDVLGRERGVGEWRLAAGRNVFDVRLGDGLATGHYLLVVRSGSSRVVSPFLVR